MQTTTTTTKHLFLILPRKKKKKHVDFPSNEFLVAFKADTMEKPTLWPNVDDFWGDSAHFKMPNISRMVNAC